MHAARWSSGKVFACSDEGPGFQSRAERFYKQNFTSLSVACDIKQDIALHSVFYAEASKRAQTREQRVPASALTILSHHHPSSILIMRVHCSKASSWGP